jgi:hypothetical protein
LKFNKFKLWTIELTRRKHSSKGWLRDWLSLVVRIYFKRIAIHLIVPWNSLDYVVLDWQNHVLNDVVILNTRR